MPVSTTAVNLVSVISLSSTWQNTLLHRSGEGNLGKENTADHRAKISEAMTGKERSAETRAAMEGRKHSAETRAKISEARKGSKKRKACIS